MNIFVGSLPFSIEEADLRESFEAYGAVDSVKIITDKFTGRSKGFGFVEMPNDDEAQKAIDELNGATVQGRAFCRTGSRLRSMGPSDISQRIGGSGSRRHHKRGLCGRGKHAVQPSNHLRLSRPTQPCLLSYITFPRSYI